MSTTTPQSAPTPAPTPERTAEAPPRPTPAVHPAGAGFIPWGVPRMRPPGVCARAPPLHRGSPPHPSPLGWWEVCTTTPQSAPTQPHARADSRSPAPTRVRRPSGGRRIYPQGGAAHAAPGDLFSRALPPSGGGPPHPSSLGWWEVCTTTPQSAPTQPHARADGRSPALTHARRPSGGRGIQPSGNLFPLNERRSRTPRGRSPHTN